VHKVVSPNGLEWTVKRLLIPLGMRPLDRIAILDAATPRRTVVEGMSNRVPDAVGAWTGPLPLGVLVLPLALLLLPIVLLLRRLRLLPWTVEARAYPWGRRFPPIVFSYDVRGGDDVRRVLIQLADALARGDGAPQIAGVDIMREPRAAHGGIVSSDSGTLYGGRR